MNHEAVNQQNHHNNVEIKNNELHLILASRD